MSSRRAPPNPDQLTRPTIPPQFRTAQPALANAIPSSAATQPRKPLQRGPYPQEWFLAENRGAVDVKAAALGHLKDYGEELRGEGANFASLAVEKSGLLQVHAQQIPRPCDPTADFSKVTICVMRIKDGDLEKEWHQAARPTQPPEDRDIRRVEKLNDVFTASAPYNDTDQIFRAGIDLSRRGDGLTWTPGRLLGVEDDRIKAPMSESQVFLPPYDEPGGLQSSTSRGHQISHSRPTGVGAGWGDWDLYREWQFHGRMGKREWVENKHWKKTDGEELSFLSYDAADADGQMPSQEEQVFSPPEPHDATMPLPQSLHEKFHDGSVYRGSHRRGHRGGHRGRGHRGGHTNLKPNGIPSGWYATISHPPRLACLTASYARHNDFGDFILRRALA
ncbi:hypothetical protein ACJZ2D_011886 [Fusarium nematophilum]